MRRAFQFSFLSRGINATMRSIESKTEILLFNDQRWEEHQGVAVPPSGVDEELVVET